MKQYILLTMLAVAVAGSAFAAKLTLKTDQDKLSYTIGADIGINFKKQGVDVDAKLMMRGYQDATAGKKLLMTDKEMSATLNSFQSKIVAKHAQEFKTLATTNKDKGADFLAKNKLKEGVVSLENGLQYKIVTSGTGEQPTAADTVTVEYTGKLIDGTVFDSTDKTGKPASFKVSDVIPGWTQALKLMKPGATWQVFIPAQLAYGERGVGGPIGPNQTLVFKIHLISVAKNKAAVKGS